MCDRNYCQNESFHKWVKKLISCIKKMKFSTFQFWPIVDLLINNLQLDLLRKERKKKNPTTRNRTRNLLMSIIITIIFNFTTVNRSANWAIVGVNPIIFYAPSPGVEPGAQQWECWMLPLHHEGFLLHFSLKIN